MRFALLVVLLLLNLPAHAQTPAPSPAAAFPFWVEVTQEYTYPGTSWTSISGMVEQVIGEDEVNYIITSSAGDQLKLPKAYSKKVTSEVAAVRLFMERKLSYDLHMQQLVRQEAMEEVLEQAKARITEYDTALKASQSKVTEYEQGMQLITALMKLEQQQRAGQQLSASEMREQLRLIQDLQNMQKGRR
jgi:hypothetical protein